MSDAHRSSLLRFVLGIGGSVAVLAVYLQSRSELAPGYWLAALVPVARGGVWPLSGLLAGVGLLTGLAGLLPARGRRKGLIALLVLCALAGGLAVAGVSPDRAWGRLADGLVVVGVLLAAFSFGLRVLWCSFGRQSGPRPLEIVVFGLLLGLASVSLLVFVLGLAGWTDRSVVVPFLAIFFVSGIDLMPRLLRAALDDLLLAAESLGPLGWAALGLLVAIGVSLLPAAFYPPLDYDVLEYHLQLPREYFDLGRIRFLPHNAFSGFPQGMEMLSTLAFVLAGNPHGSPLALSHGVWIAKLLNFAFLPILLLAIALIVRRLAGERSPGALTAGLVAAGLALACMRTLSLPMVLYVELGLGAYALGALLALAGAWEEYEAGRWVVLAGLLAGAAASCKYTGLLFVGAPVVLLLLVVPQTYGRWHRRLAHAVLAGVFCWAVLAPWLVRNAVETGNPFYPIWNQAFEVPAWTALQEERFQQAHRPAYQGRGAGTYSLAALGQEAYRLAIGGKRTLLGRTVTGRELGALLLVFVPGLLCLTGAGKRRGARALALWYAGAFLLWFFLTHRLERFFYQAALLSSVLSGLGLAGLLECAGDGRIRRWLVHAAVAAVLVAVACSAALVVGGEYFQPVERQRPNDRASRPLLSVLLGAAPVEPMLAGRYGPWLLREAMARDPVLQAGRVLLVGAADPFWLPGNVSYAVVFSDHPLFTLLRGDLTPEEIARHLRQQGITHLYVSWPELARLSSTYAGAYRLSEAQQGVLRTLLGTCQYRPLSGRWSVGRVERGWIPGWVEGQAVLLPGGRPAGRYCLAPRELFALPVPSERASGGP